MASPQYSIYPNPRVPFEVAFQDECLLIASKPPGVVTQPGVGHTRDTLLNGVFALHGKRLQNLGKVRDFGLVHRLDRATSGLVMVALERATYDAMRRQFKERLIEKTYLALIHGQLSSARGIVDAPISQVRIKGRKRARLGASPRAQEAITEYRVVATSSAVSLVECRPKTGRLHQIRAHLAHMGHPVVGDFEYGRRVGLDRIMGRNRFWLHAGRLCFVHPHSRQDIQVQIPPPELFLKAAEQLGAMIPKRWMS